MVFVSRQVPQNDRTDWERRHSVATKVRARQASPDRELPEATATSLKNWRHANVVQPNVLLALEQPIVRPKKHSSKTAQSSNRAASATDKPFQTAQQTIRPKIKDAPAEHTKKPPSRGAPQACGMRSSSATERRIDASPTSARATRDA